MAVSVLTSASMCDSCYAVSSDRLCKMANATSMTSITGAMLKVISHHSLVSAASGRFFMQNSIS
uniref:Uncharacterized protein n=1 Tax=Hyaloperonospora arabidopsidis (strain Emoy2) TaxID=559515 RepID=M4BYX0_HYAAE